MPDTTPAKSIFHFRMRVRNRLKRSPRMLADTFWTFTGNVLSVLSGLAVFKIIGALVPSSEYGQASLVLGVVALLSQFIAGPRVLAHLRLYFTHMKQGRGVPYAAAVSKLLFETSILMAVAYLAIALGYRVSSNRAYWSLAVPAILLLFLQTQLTGTFTFLEAEKRYRGLTVIQTISKVLQVPFLALLLLVSISGPNAILYSQVLSVLAVVVLWGTRSAQINHELDNRSSFSAGDIANSASLAFGWSLYLITFFGWILATSDRYIIDHYWTEKEVGIYAMNYGLWSIPYLTLNSWLEMLIRSRVFERAESNDWTGARKLVIGRLGLAVALGLLGTAFLLLLGKRIAFAIVGGQYWSEDKLMLLICSGHFFYVVGISPYSIFMAAKRVGTMARVFLVASVLNILLNIVLVPRLGIAGAGWSTLISYMVLCLLLFVTGHKLMAGLVRKQIHIE